MAESIADLEKRHSLLHAIKQLLDEIGDDLEDLEDLEKRYSMLHAINATLKEIKEHAEWCPDEDEMRAVGDYLATLKEIAETDAPDEEERKAVGEHLATLKEIEGHESN
jgi:protein subunit release factor A